MLNESGSPIQGYCEIHHKVLAENSRRSIQFKSPNATVLCDTQAYNFYPNSESVPLVCSLATDVYLFTCNSVDIPVTDELQQVFRDLSKILSTKIIKLGPSVNEEVKMKIKKFIDTTFQVIYNLNVDTAKLYDDIDVIYNKYYEKVTDLNIEYINKLLENAQKVFEMKEKTRVKLLFTLNLVEEKQKFVAIFMSEPVIDMGVFESKFKDFFNNFITTKNNELPRMINEFQYGLAEQQKLLKDNFEAQYFACLFNYLTSLSLCRVGVFSCRLINNYSLSTDLRLNWEMVSCLILEKTSCSIAKPVELSRSELLIPLHLNTTSYILYYSGTGSPALIQTFRTTAFLISPGSFVERIFIYKKLDNKVHEYTLSNSRLLLKKEYDSLCRKDENITCIAFIKESERLIFVVDYKQVFLKILNSSVRADINHDENDGRVCDLDYNKEKKIVFIKSEYKLKLYNIHLQVIALFPVMGNQIATVYTFSELGYGICIKDNFIIEVRINGLSKDAERNSMIFTANKPICACQWSMSKDHINLIKSSSRYCEAVNKKFNLPLSYLDSEGITRDKMAPQPISIEKIKNFEEFKGSAVANGLPNIPQVPLKIENSDLPDKLPNSGQNNPRASSGVVQGPPVIPKIPPGIFQGPPGIPKIPSGPPPQIINPGAPSNPIVNQGPPGMPQIISQGPPSNPIINQGPPSSPPIMNHGPPIIPKIPSIPNQGPPSNPIINQGPPGIPPIINQGPPSNPIKNQGPPGIPPIINQGPPSNPIINQGPPGIPPIINQGSPSKPIIMNQGPPIIPKLPSGSNQGPPGLPQLMNPGPPFIPKIPSESSQGSPNIPPTINQGPSIIPQNPTKINQGPPIMNKGPPGVLPGLNYPPSIPIIPSVPNLSPPGLPMIPPSSNNSSPNIPIINPGPPNMPILIPGPPNMPSALNQGPPMSSIKPTLPSASPNIPQTDLKNMPPYIPNVPVALNKAQPFSLPTLPGNINSAHVPGFPQLPKPIIRTNSIENVEVDSKNLEKIEGKNSDSNSSSPSSSKT